MNAPYAVNLDLAAKSVLVVGGGRVAARKVAGLLKAGANVTVVAPVAVPEIADDPDVRWFPRSYQRGEIASYRLGITATNNAEVNALVARDAHAAAVFVNSADDPDNCSFTLPAVARRGDIQIAVSTNGRSPGLARWLRRRYELELSAGYDQLLDLLSEARSELRSHGGTTEVPGWDDALNADILGLVRRGRIEDARAVLRKALGLSPADANASPAEVAS